LAAYTTNPSLQHVGALKRILRYLAGTKSVGITYSRLPRVDANSFHGYADAAFANTDDYRSTSGYVFIAAGGVITWQSKKQTMIALSSTEAEYVALSEAGQEACWLRSLYAELGERQNIPSQIKGDNDGSIARWRAIPSSTKGLSILQPDGTEYTISSRKDQLLLTVVVTQKKQRTY
jgi:hypothetical protein